MSDEDLVQTLARTDITFRTATSDDSDKVQRLLLQLGYQQPTARVCDLLRTVYHRDDHAAMVATIANEVVAFIHVYERITLRDGRMLEVDSLVVKEHYRGLGLGTMLLQAAEEWSVARGLTRIMLSTNSRREQTHGYYRSRGYTEIKQSLVFEKAVLARVDNTEAD